MGRREWLVKTINHFHFKSIAEIGVERGGTSKHILSNCPQAFLYMIDAWTDSTPIEGMEYYKGKNHQSQENDSRKVQKLFSSRAVVMKMLSHEAADCFDDESLDLIFIDACHSYKAVSLDIKKWLPKVKRGGIVSGHDYNHPNFPGVAEAVDEAFQGDVTLGPNYVWYRRKD